MSRKKETRMNPSLFLTLKKLQADSEIMVEPCDKRDTCGRPGRMLWEAQSHECPADGHTKPGSPRRSPRLPGSDEWVGMGLRGFGWWGCVRAQSQKSHLPNSQPGLYCRELSSLDLTPLF